MMDEYAVRPGVRFGATNQYGPGDKVFLSPQEAAGFADKLEPVSSVAEEGGQDSQWGTLGTTVVKALEAAELTPDGVRAMGDEDLLAVKGVGPAALVAIRAALGVGGGL